MTQDYAAPQAQGDTNIHSTASRPAAQSVPVRIAHRSCLALQPEQQFRFKPRLCLGLQFSADQRSGIVSCTGMALAGRLLIKEVRFWRGEMDV